MFPRPITSLAWDSAERFFFGASADGFIHRVNLFRQKRDPSGRGQSTMEAVGGPSRADIFDGVSHEDTLKRLIMIGCAHWGVTKGYHLHSFSGFQ